MRGGIEGLADLQLALGAVNYDMGFLQRVLVSDRPAYLDFIDEQSVTA